MYIAKQCASSPHIVPNQAPSGPQFVFTFLQTIASLTLCDYAFGDVVVRYILVFIGAGAAFFLSLLVSLLACLKAKLLILLLWFSIAITLLCCSRDGSGQVPRPTVEVPSATGSWNLTSMI